jgi:tetratricopeptide (TPR) repeat protein
MAEDDGLLSDESGENTMLHEAMDALRQGDRAQARDLLTRLLKTDQNNPTYWVWLNAALDTQKERLYCLQMALQADPQNAAAKRGLILLGAPLLPPDDSVPPFPLNRGRLWEEKLTMLQEPKESKRGWANPVVRLFIILGIAMIVIGGLFIGSSLLPNKATPLRLGTPTHRPTMTITFTTTVTPAYRTSTPTFLGPTPLGMFLASTYTPTPLYMVTQHPIVSRSAIEAGLRNAEAYFQRGTAYLNLDNPNLAEADFKAALTYDPSDFDSQLGLARAYFMQGKPGNAYMQAEQKAMPLARVDGTRAQVYYWEALFLEAIGDPTSDLGARNNWYKLIALPADVMPEAWRTEAYQHLNITPTFTPTLTVIKTLTTTPTLLPTTTPTIIPTVRLTKIPTATQTP